MPKEGGMGDLLFVAGYDLSGDVGAVSNLSLKSGVLDTTGINATAHERIHANVDGELTFNHFFNDAALQEHVALKAKGSGVDRVVMYCHGSGIGEVAWGMVTKQINYDWARGADGSLLGTTQCLGNLYALEPLDQLTAGKRTDTGATNGASHDNGVATALGLSAYLEVFSVTGTSMTVAVQESSNDGAGDAFATILTFTTVAAGAVGHERKSLATLTTAVERYLRAITTGTFNPGSFAVGVCRNPHAV